MSSAGASVPIVLTGNLSRQFPNGTWGLKGVTLALERGSWVTVTGRSGAGKSTFLAILGSLERATSGSVRVEGHDLSTLTEREAARFRSRTVGFVFQHYYLVPYLTVLENVMVAQHLCQGADQPRAVGILEEVGLGSRLHHLPHELSGGEQQRACIARATVNSPTLLLADEPTGNLDEENRRAVYKLLRSHHARGTTVVLVTHDPPELGWAHRLLRLDGGRITDDRQVGARAQQGRAVAGGMEQA